MRIKEIFKKNFNISFDLNCFYYKILNFVYKIVEEFLIFKFVWNSKIFNFKVPNFQLVITMQPLETIPLLKFGKPIKN